MKNKIFPGFLLLAGLFLCAPQCFAQGIQDYMSGRVTNTGGRGISGARVEVIDTGCPFPYSGAQTQTNPFGYYQVIVQTECGRIIVVSAKTYQTQNVFRRFDEPLENVDFVLLKDYERPSGAGNAIDEDETLFSPLLRLLSSDYCSAEENAGICSAAALSLLKKESDK